MSEHTARIQWLRSGGDFAGNRYSRAHTWTFDGGATIDASPSPDIVPAPMSVAEYVDPEEAFVAAVSSCHMLFFLSLAASKGFVVEDYVDDAVGFMSKNDQGRMAINELVLNPRATYSGATLPAPGDVQKLHHRAHEMCFIANSIRTRIETRIRS